MQRKRETNDDDDDDDNANSSSSIMIWPFYCDIKYGRTYKYEWVLESSNPTKISTIFFYVYRFCKIYIFV